MNDAGLTAGPSTPVRSSQQHFSADLQPATQPPPPQPEAQLAVAGQDWSAQIEQMRNDIFGIAMNVSALNDRLDRLEQRLSPAESSSQTGLATLRDEIQTWLETHLNAAVEHCLHRVIHRTHSTVSPTVN